MVELNGIPFTADVSAANVHDSMTLASMLDAIPTVGNSQPGRPRRRPRKLHADKAYDYRRCRRACRVRGIEASERLGRYRWVVERTIGWLANFRKLTIRYERRADIHLALLTLGCALICFNMLHHQF
jgi:transposase